MDLARAYSLLTIKSLDDDQRVIEGIATTPEPDRAGDILEPKGAEFALPFPLLWQHSPGLPNGHVTKATVTKDGISIRAQFAKAGITPEIDQAWALVKAGLVRGLSPGLRIKEAEPIEPRNPFGPLRITKWEMVELSLVTIPANRSATITTVKSLYGAADPLITRAQSPLAAAGRHRHTGSAMKPVSEQLITLGRELTTKATRFEILSLKADAELEDTEITERDTLNHEIKSLTGQIDRLKTLEAAYAASAAPVLIKAAPANPIGNPYPAIVGPTPPRLEPGIGLARAVICQMAAMKSAGRRTAFDLAKQYYPDYAPLHLFLKEDVPAASTQDSSFAGPLVYPQNLASEFIEFLRPQTIVGRIDSFTRVPFNVRVGGQTSGAMGYWVGEAKAKPLTMFGTTAQTLGWYKVANIIALSQDLARFSSPSAELLVRNELANACRERIDRDFIDPDKALVAGVSPASITHGITNINSSGTSLANVDTDVKNIMTAFAEAFLVPTHWIMPNSIALALSLMRTSLGARAFPDITMNGGTFMGLPVVTSQYCILGTPANNLVALIAAPEIFLADDGEFAIDMSREASLEMNDAPTMDAGALGSPVGATGSKVVSMFQTNSIAIRCERFINWARKRETAVAWLDDVQWSPS